VCLCEWADFGNLFFKTAASLLESHANMKNKVLHVLTTLEHVQTLISNHPRRVQSIRAAVFALFSLSVKKFQFYVRGTTCIVHLLNKYEHLPLHLAELLQCAAEQHDCPRLLGDVIRYVRSGQTAQACCFVWLNDPCLLACV